MRIPLLGSSGLVRCMAIATLVSGLLSGLAPSATAAISIFTNQGEFEALFASPTSSFLNTFTESAGTQANYTTSSNGFSYTATQNIGANTYLTGTIIQANAGNRDLVFTATGGNYNAIGGNFFLSNGNGAFQSAGVTITVSNGTESAAQTYTPTGATQGSFVGFYSTLPITTLTVGKETSTGGTILYNSADNLRVGAGILATVPEPGTFALLGLGTASAVMIIRRRAPKV